MNLGDMNFNQKLQLLKSDTNYAISKKTGKVDTSYDNKIFGNLRAKITSQISHIPIPGREKIKTGKKAKQLLIEHCKADLKVINKIITDPTNGLKKQYEDLKNATPEEFPKKLEKLSEQINLIEQDVLVCLTDIELHSHLLADAKEDPGLKSLLSDLNEIKQIHENLTQFNEIKDSIVNFRPPMLSITVKEIMDNNSEFLMHFGKEIAHMVADRVKENPSLYESHKKYLEEIASYCGVDHKQFLQECGLKSDETPTATSSHFDLAQLTDFEERDVDTTHLKAGLVGFEEREDSTNGVPGLLQDVMSGVESFMQESWSDILSIFEDFPELTIPMQEPSMSQVDVQKSLETLKAISPTFATVAEGRTDLEQIVKETVGELKTNIGHTAHEIQERQSEVRALKGALESHQKEFPNSIFLSTAQLKLNELESSLVLRGQLLRMSDQIQAKSARVEAPIYLKAAATEFQPTAKSYSEPSHNKAADALAAVTTLAKAACMFTMKDEKLNKQYRMQFEKCLSEIRHPPVPMTKAWCEQKIKEMELLSSLAKVEGTHKVRYTTAPFEAYKKQLETHVKLLKQLEQLETLLPNANVESTTLQERAHTLISQALQEIATTPITHTNIELEAALNKVLTSGLVDSNVAENSQNIFIDLKLQRELLHEIQKIFPDAISETHFSLDQLLEKALTEIMHLEVPKEARELPKFAENIQHVRRHITHFASQMNHPPENYLKAVAKLQNLEQEIHTRQLGLTDRTIKNQLEKIQNAEKSSLEEFQKLNLEAVKGIVQALISIPEEQSSSGFSARLILMQEVTAHFTNIPGMEEPLKELQTAMNNFKGAKEALEFLEGKKLVPEAINANRNDSTFEIAQDLVTKKAKEQWDEYEQKLKNIQSGTLSSTAAIEEFRQASIIAERLIMTSNALGTFIEGAEDLNELVHTKQIELQEIFIKSQIDKLNLDPGELIGNLLKISSMFSDNPIILQQTIETLINRTLQNIEGETNIEILTAQRNLLQECVSVRIGGNAIIDKLALYNDLIDKLEHFSNNPVENLEVIQLMIDKYPESAIFALGDKVNELLTSIENNPGTSSEQLQAASQLLGQIHEKITHEKLEMLQERALKIKDNLQNAEATIKTLLQAMQQFEAASSPEDKLHFAEQFCTELINSEEALSKFPTVSESLVGEFSAEIHKTLKAVKSSVREEFQSLTGNPLTFEESPIMFEQAALYTNAYAALISILGEGSNDLIRAKAKLEKFSSEIKQVQENIQASREHAEMRTSVLHEDLVILEEKLETLNNPVNLQDKLDEIADLYDAAQEPAGHFPNGLKWPLESAPTMSTLAHEPLKASCERQIETIQEELKSTQLDIQEAKETIIDLQKQKDALSEPFDIKRTIQNLCNAHGLPKDGANTQEYFEAKYAEHLADFESKQGLSQVGGWLSKIGASLQEITGTITTLETGKQAELNRLQATYGQKPPDALLGLAAIVDTFSATNTQKNKTQGQLAIVATKLQQQEDLLSKLEARVTQDQNQLKRLESLQKAITIATSVHENGETVIESAMKITKAREEHELKIEVVQFRLEALSTYQEMLGAVLEQSFVMERFDSAKGAVDAMHQFIQLLQQEGHTAENRLGMYQQLQEINNQCKSDPIFQKLLAPYIGQLEAIDKEFNPR